MFYDVDDTEGLVTVRAIRLDEDQLQLAASDKFWQLITTRRKQPTVSRGELEGVAASHDVT